MITTLFKGICFIGIMFCYSLAVWKGINEYFRKEFNVYIADELKNTKPEPSPIDTKMFTQKINIQSADKIPVINTFLNDEKITKFINDDDDDDKNEKSKYNFQPKAFNQYQKTISNQGNGHENSIISKSVQKLFVNNKMCEQHRQADNKFADTNDVNFNEMSGNRNENDGKSNVIDGKIKPEKMDEHDERKLWKTRTEMAMRCDNNDDSGNDDHHKQITSVESDIGMVATDDVDNFIKFQTEPSETLQQTTNYYDSINDGSCLADAM